VTRQRISVCVAVACVLGVVTSRAQSGLASAADGGASVSVVPRVIKFSGAINPEIAQIKESETGKNTSPRVVGITFSLYELQEGGSPLWSESQSVQLDGQGRYIVLLGATQVDGLPLDLFISGKALWLGVQPQFPGAVEQSRVLLVAVPYALKASDSDTLGGKPASAYALAGSQTLVVPAGSAALSSPSTSTAQHGSQAGTASGTASSPQPGAACSSLTSDGTATANSLAIFTTNCNIEASAITQTNGNLGISGASPAFTKFQITDTPAADFGTHYTNHELLNTSVTKNGTNKGLTFVMDLGNTAIPAGVTDSGYRIAVEGAGYANTSSFAGTLGAQYGVWGRAGLLGATAGATVSNAYAGYFDIFNAVPGTTITNAYGVYIANSATTGTITNRYDLYASSGNGKSYFAGKVGIGTNAPAAKLEVNGTAKFDQPVTFAASQTFPGGVITGSETVQGNLSASGQLISTVAQGTAPLQVTSTTQVPNLNASLLGGFPASAFQPAGSYAVTTAANSFTGTQTVSSGDLSVAAGDINLPQTSSATSGVINFGGYQFAHNCCPGYPGNTFLGLNAGNFSVNGSDPNTGLSGNTGVGFWALNSLTSGWANTAVGFYALLANTTGQTNTAVGYQALESDTTGGPNTAVGFRALQLNTTGGGNTAMGYFTLSGNTTGAFNTAYGESALSHNTTGQLNTAVGKGALEVNSTGYWDTATGNAALDANTTGYLNTADGVQALYANTTGLYNTADGAFALSNNTTGTGNIALGYEAGITSDFSNSTGSYNTYIGTYATPFGASQDTISYATAIGANSGVEVSNAMVLGATTDVLGNPLQIDVGIGTLAPAYILDVNGSGPVRVNDTTGGDIVIGQNKGVNKFRVDSTGKGFFDGGTQTGGADFAESVPVRGGRAGYEPGDLLVIDTAADRHLALSRNAYSTLVAGIYSTKPGMLASPHTMDDPRLQSEEVPMAVVGIVPCKVSAENGPIHRGDLLVTSSRPGYAMKGTDRRRLVGAVVGKALEALPQGAGVIQVLVTLQ